MPLLNLGLELGEELVGMELKQLLLNLSPIVLK